MTWHFGLDTLATGDAELFDTLYLQTDKTTTINSVQPFRIDGWSDVRADAAGLLSLPPGFFNSVVRQTRVDLLGDDVAIFTGHFIVNVGPPGAPVFTQNGRFTTVLQKIDGKWLIVHRHLSALP